MPKARRIMPSLSMPSSWAVTGSSETACKALPLRLPSSQTLSTTSNSTEIASSSTCTVRTWAPPRLRAAGRAPRVPMGMA